MIEWDLEGLSARGGPDFSRIVQAAREVTFQAVDELADGSPLVKALSRRFERPKLLQAFHKALGPSVFADVARIEAARLDAAGKPAVLWLARTPASGALGSYAAQRGVELHAYGTPLRSVPWKAAWRRITARRHGTVTGGPSAALSAMPDSRLVPRAGHPYIGYWIAGRLVSFDPADRTDMFWLIDSPVDHSDVLAYFTRADAPAAQTVGATLADAGMSALALEPGATRDASVPRWRPGSASKRTTAELQREVIRGAVSSAVRFRRGTLLLTAYCLDFVRSYAYWREFFKSTGIRVSMSQYDFTRPYMAKNQALADLGGVSVSYQYSNLDFSSAEMSMSADVLFTLGPRYRGAYSANRSTIDSLVEVGYITDNSFEAVGQRAHELRTKLEARGVRYVVSYFDEGSSDARLSAIGIKTAEDAYLSLFEWLVASPDVGLILKPKAPATLRDRLGLAAVALDAAIATGRCVMLGADGDVRTTSSYPCEAARAADLSIGLLISGTAALESHLIGCRTVFLDAQHLSDNAAYANGGEGRIVFTSVAAIREAAMRFRDHPEAIVGFGDLTEWAADRVRLRDGRSAERIGTYVKWLYDSLVAGATREEALQDAADRYARAWGEEYVERVRGWR